MRIEYLLGVLIYLLALLVLGLRFPGRLQTFESFFLASRSLGALRIAFSLCASWIGAATLLVSTDEAFREGVSALWVIGVPAVVTLLVFVPLARPLRALSGSTISDLMEARYGKPARILTTILIVWYMMVLAASQLVAAGTFLKTFLGMSYLASLAAVFAVVLLYSWAGGFLSVVRTHGLQALLLLAGIGGLLGTLLGRVTWADLRAAAASQAKPGYLDFFSNAERNLLIAASFVLAWTISPIAWQRIQAARAVPDARRGLGLAALMLGGVYAAIVASGMLFLPIFPGSPPPHPLISEFLASEAAVLPGAVLFLAVLAAILSTMDAALNAGAFSLAKDVLHLSRSPARAGRPVRLSRMSTLVLGVGAFLVATRFDDILKTLGLASKIMAEGLFIPGMAALYLKRRLPLAGILGLAAGGGYALLCFLEETGTLAVGLPLWPRSLPLGMLIAAGGFLLGAGAEMLGRGKRP